jgi:EAL domain-containing protein (putative c-di-GMP-specific phosphodiesterase class I)
MKVVKLCYNKNRNVGSERVESMVRRYLEKAKSVLQWGKIIFPLSSLRFYPPQFILRNPVLEGVKSALLSGHEVAVVVFNLKNIEELAEEFGPSHFSLLMKKIKRSFRLAVEQELSKQNIIALHDFYSDGLTLFMKLDYDNLTTSEIDYTINQIIDHVERYLLKAYPSIKLTFETGFMFVEKGSYSISDNIAKAHRQAIAVAEKSIKSNYSDMMLMLNKIIAQKDIRLLAQPIIDVATKEIRAWEMLTRGPQGTVLENPLPLFSIARQTGLLYELEMIVLEKVFEQIKATRCRQDIFVNCTPLTLGKLRFPRELKMLLHKFTGISPTQIIIEVTENDSIEGIKNFIYNIKLLRIMGFRIAMDDTGAGYSNLRSISEIMPDIIKIDRSVIENIDQNSLKESMLKGLLLVAREAGSLVVAEGIEREEEALVLKRNNVDLAQGYLYSPPTLLMAT